MRIIAGRWRGKPLVAPPGEATRPTNARAREALFSMLTSRIGTFEGLAVVDLFAGTGALGLEAMSRGCAHGTFVETDRAAVAALRRNIDRMGAEVTLLTHPAQSLGRAPRLHDLALLDPPYGSGLVGRTLARLADGWLAPGAWVSVETAKDEAVAANGFTLDAVRDHGKARLHLLRFAA
jgi:16S rRNA (guanine966-N2)-methyltransferase